MTDYLQARAMWAAMTLAERTRILHALEADETMANHDFAGLPPQLHRGIIAGMPVAAVAPAPSEPEETKSEPEETKPRSRGR